MSTNNQTGVRNQSVEFEIIGLDGNGKSKESLGVFASKREALKNAKSERGTVVVVKRFGKHVSCIFSSGYKSALIKSEWVTA